MFFERKAARLLGCRLEPVLFNPHIRALHIYYNLGNFHFKKVITTHDLAQKDRQRTNYKIPNQDISSWNSQCEKWQKDSLGFAKKLQWSKISQTYSVKWGREIDCDPGSNEHKHTNAKPVIKKCLRTVNPFTAKGEWTMLSYFIIFLTLPILEIFHSSDVSC